MKLWVVVCAVVGASSLWVLRALQPPAPVPVARPDQPLIHMVAEDDPDILEAAERARATVDQLLEAIVRQDGRPRHAQIKVRIEDAGVAEHVWLVDLRYEGGMIYGSLGNHPLELPNWKLGDPAMTAPGDITDWLLIDETGFHGGFTLRAAREDMTDQERERFDNDFNIHFGVAPGSSE